MLKKLALAVSCIYCCSLYANPYHFRNNDEQIMANDIDPELVEKTIPSSIENVPGYSELMVASKSFRNNETNTIDAIAVEYRANIMRELTAAFDQKYFRTYTRKTFFGGISEIEYLVGDGNSLIRVIRTFNGHTILLKGTIQWFDAYDKSRRQLKEIRRMRTENIERMRQAKFEQMKPEKSRWDFARAGHDHKNFEDRGFWGADRPHFRDEHAAPKFKGQCPHHPKKFKPEMKRERPRDIFDESFSTFDEIFSDSFDKFFNNDFFKEDIKPIKMKKPFPKEKSSEDSQTQTYNFSQTYSKVNDVEELKRNDNGDVTEVLKTPEKITITHNGVTKSVSPEDLKSAGGVVKLAKELDPNCEVEVVFVDDDAKMPRESKVPKKCCCPPAEHKNFPLRSAENRGQDPRIKYCMPPAKENFSSETSKLEEQSPENELMTLYSQL